MDATTVNMESASVCARQARVPNRSSTEGQAAPIKTISIATDFNEFVTTSVGRMTRTSGKIDQQTLRSCLSLASSYLVSDTTMDPSRGLTTWCTGFNRLVDLLVLLHTRGELELETVSAGSKACSECWSAAGTWRELEDCKESIRAIAVRLKSVLDPNGRTYRGGLVYVP